MLPIEPGISSRDASAVVLGAGVSGLVAARLLRRRGFERVALLDRYSLPGGNHIDCTIGPYTYDIGTIIFQDDSPFLRHFPELLALYHPVEPSISRVAPDSAVRTYPIDAKAEIFNAGPWEWARIATSLVAGRLQHRTMRNARDFIHHWMGRRLAERTGISSYVERFYGLTPDQIDITFAQKRMLWIADAASLLTRLARLLSPPPPWEGGRSFVRPRAGFGALYAPAVKRLLDEGVEVHLGVDLQSIRHDKGQLVLTTSTAEWQPDTIVSTIPLADSLALCGLDDVVAAPPTMELLTLFFSFAGERGFSTNILYNFSHEGSWKRITMFSDFYGIEGDRAYFGVEINRSTWFGLPSCPAEEEAARFMYDVRAKNLFRGQLTFEGAHLLGNAYPVYRIGAQADAARAIASLAEHGIVSIGRQGGFDYLPTARHATLAAEESLLGEAGPHDASALAP